MKKLLFLIILISQTTHSSQKIIKHVKHAANKISLIIKKQPTSQLPQLPWELWFKIAKAMKKKGLMIFCLGKEDLGFNETTFKMARNFFLTPYYMIHMRNFAFSQPFISIEEVEKNTIFKENIPYDNNLKNEIFLKESLLHCPYKKLSELLTTLPEKYSDKITIKEYEKTYNNEIIKIKTLNFNNKPYIAFLPLFDLDDTSALFLTEIINDLESLQRIIICKFNKPKSDNIIFLSDQHFYKIYSKNIIIQDQFNRTIPYVSKHIRHNQEKMKYLIKNCKHNIYVRNNFGTTLFNYVCSRKESGLVLFLTYYDIDFNTQDCTMHTPLHNTIFHDHINNKDIIDLLIKHDDANPNIVDKEGNTPLHIVAYQGNNASNIKLLIESTNFNCKNNNGETPLKRAHIGKKKNYPHYDKKVLNILENVDQKNPFDSSYYG